MILQDADIQMVSGLKTTSKSREVKDVEINVLADKFKVCVQVADIEDGRGPQYRSYGLKATECDKTYKLVRYRNHYFINELTQFTKYYMEHTNELSISQHDFIKEGTRLRKAPISRTKHFLNTAELIPMLFSQGAFRDMTYEEYAKFPFIKYKLSDEDDLSYTEELGTKQFKFREAKHKDREGVESTLWFADFEASTHGDKHVPFMVC
jgi:hypothetical protein